MIRLDKMYSRKSENSTLDKNEEYFLSKEVNIEDGKYKFYYDKAEIICQPASTKPISQTV